MNDSHNRASAEGASKNLFTAAQAGDLSAIKRLLGAGADPNRFTRDQLWPLNYARDPETVAVLLASDFDERTRNRRGACAAHMVVETDRPELLEWLADRGGNLEVRDACNETSLTWATAYGRIECLRALLKLGACVNPPGLRRTPLHWAAKENQLAAAELLLEHGASLSVRAPQIGAPLHVAVEHGAPEMVRLMTRFAKEDELNIGHRKGKGHSPLHRAAANNNAQAARVLLAAGAMPEARDRNNWTPLHWAVKNWSVEVAEALMEHGANPKAKSSNGTTPADLARRRDAIRVNGKVYVSAAERRREPLRRRFLELFERGTNRRSN